MISPAPLGTARPRDRGTPPGICTVVRAVRKVYIDHMQNRHGQLIVAPFSVRAKAAASVSMPIKWSELNGRLKNANYHIENALRRLKRAGDPMRDLLTDEPDLKRALARLAGLVGKSRIERG